MRGMALPAEVLRARRFVRAVVVCDGLGAATALGYALEAGRLPLLMFGSLGAALLLVCDSGAWRLDIDDLRRRMIDVQPPGAGVAAQEKRSEEHTSEPQSHSDLVYR